MTTMTDANRAAFDATEVGDVFVSSWGYDQTNVDFYLVVGKTAARVQVVEIGKIRDEGTSGSDHVRPDKRDRIGKVKTKTIQGGYQGEACFRISSYAHACRWDGSPRYETGRGWGH